MAGEKILELPPRAFLFDHAIMNIRTVEARYENARLAEIEALDDLVARRHVRGRGERDARHSREAFVQHRELTIFGPEIVTPLRHAVRLVDRK